MSLLVQAERLSSQEPAGTVTGRVTRSGEGTPLAGISVSAKATGHSTVSRSDGRYTLHRVPAGAQTIVFRWPGYRPGEMTVEVPPNGTLTVDAALEPVPLRLSEIIVAGASLAPDRIVEAPAAISTVDAKVLERASITGQAPLALQSVPGLDVVQSGLNDFNVNARGFNSSLTRRVLVLQDGRDLAIAFLGGAQEWNALALPLEDIGKVEVVRGPGSALYGANAFSGVVSITTPTARELLGTKISLGAGELNTVRTDVRYAGLLGDGRFGYRMNLGYNRSDTWSRSRTLADGSSLQREYAGATDEPVPRMREVRPILGQTVDSATGQLIGDRDALRNIYGSGRVDFYADNGSVVSLDGGAARVENELLVTGAGRVQVPKVIRPFARLAWAADRFNLFAYWSSRTTLGPEYSLASGRAIEDRSDIFHVEAQGNNRFLEHRARVIYGASYRNVRVSTSGTLVAPTDDDRSDDIYSAFGQVEYKVHPKVRLVAAGRFDQGTLFDGRLSPKGAIVFSPNENHSFWASVNRAFQTPNYAEFFLRITAGAPANFSALESALRASSLGPSLADVPAGQLFGGGGGQSSTVPVLALGNANLDVERITGWELGYKGAPSNRTYLSANVFLNTIQDFVTDLLPGVNATYGPWSAPAEVPAQFQGALEQTVHSLLSASQPRAAAGLTRVDGQTAIVLSYTNAGKVQDWGVEFGAGYQFTPEIHGDVSFSAFDFKVQSQALGDQLVPDTPSQKAHFSATYTGRNGLDLSAGLHLVDGYEWAAGVFAGYVPASETVDLGVGYDIHQRLRIYATTTNLLDQKRFQLFGGSVIGRRVLAGVTAVF